MDVRVREATEHDAQFLAWAILVATRSHLSRGWIDIILDRPESECLRFLSKLVATKARSQWHYSGFMVAQIEGLPVAAICALPAADAYSQAAEATIQALQESEIGASEIDAIQKRGSYAIPCAMRPSADSFVIEVLATSREHRGCGLAATLLSQALEAGRRLQLKTAEVFCTIGNRPAERIYQQTGFVCTEEKRDAHFESVSGAPGMRRFVMTL